MELELWPEKLSDIVDRLDSMKDALQSNLIAAKQDSNKMLGKEKFEINKHSHARMHLHRKLKQDRAERDLVQNMQKRDEIQRRVAAIIRGGRFPGDEKR